MEHYGREVTHNGLFIHLTHLLKVPSWPELCVGRAGDSDRVLSSQNQAEKISRERPSHPSQRIWGLIYGRSSLASRCGCR